VKQLLDTYFRAGGAKFDSAQVNVS